MKQMQLRKTDHTRKAGETGVFIKPNVSDSCILKEGNEVVGLYISDVSHYDKKLVQIMQVANAEFCSSRVPKTLMERADVLQGIKEGLTRAEAQKQGLCVQVAKSDAIAFLDFGNTTRCDQSYQN